MNLKFILLNDTAINLLHGAEQLLPRPTEIYSRRRAVILQEREMLSFLPTLVHVYNLMGQASPFSCQSPNKETDHHHKIWDVHPKTTG